MTNPTPEALIRYFRRVAHELANPSNALATHLELIALHGSGNDALSEVLDRAQSDIQRLMADAKRALYLPPIPLDDTVEPVPMGALIDTVWHDLAVTGCRLRNDVGPGVSWPTARSGAYQVLACLLANAVESGAPEVAVNGDHQRLCIDNATDSTVDSARWHEPFFTSKSERGHLGIGLNIAEHAWRALGGSLSLQVADGHCRVELVP